MRFGATSSVARADSTPTGRFAVHQESCNLFGVAPGRSKILVVVITTLLYCLNGKKIITKLCVFPSHYLTKYVVNYHRNGLASDFFKDIKKNII